MTSRILQRREVGYWGEVQGVGFRYTAMSIARSYEVSGYVMNRADGSVLLVAEGREAELDRFLAEIDAAMQGNIRERTVKNDAATGEFAGFVIRT